jgi:glycerol-3-phosphate cytidylyltransferase-like family protein
MTPQEKAIQLIDKFTYWNTSQAEREGILSALNVVDEVLNIIEYKDLKYWDEVKNEIINYKNNLV